MPQLIGAFLSKLARPANARRAFSWLRSALPAFRERAQYDAVGMSGSGVSARMYGCAPLFIAAVFQVWPRSGKEDRGH